MNNELSDKLLFEQVKNSNSLAFEKLFVRYYPNLCTFASGILKNDAHAEEIVQDLFVKLWEKRNELIINSSVKNYFFRSVRNACFNFIEHKKTRQRFQQKKADETTNQNNPENNFIEVNLRQQINEAINSLPDKRKTIFLLSREHGLKYREIAKKLNISIKTVETQMGLALKHLREKLKHYNFIFITFLYRSEK